MDSEYKEPSYEQVFPDLILIGVHHRGAKIRGKYTSRFEKTLSGLSHLFFEGTREVQNSLRQEKENRYESRALDIFKGQVHFLDKNSDRIRILTDQGMQRLLPGIFIILNNLENIITETSKRKDFIPNIRRYLECGKSMGSSFYNIDIEEIIKIFDPIHERLISDEDLFIDCAEATDKFNKYMARLRDYKIYFPKIAELRLNLPEAKKGVIFGANHVEPIRKLLTGEVDPSYPSWGEYTQKLDDGSKRGIKFLEEFVMVHSNG